MDRICRLEVKRQEIYAVERDGQFHWLDGDPFGSYRVGDVVEDHSGRLLPPVQPSKIVAVGLNYRDHAREMGKALPTEPLIFLKPPTAVIGPGEKIVIPDVGRVDFESEVGIVIGRTARNVSLARANEYVLGLTCVNDVTARELQMRDVQYTRAKGFDSFAPLGPAIAVGLDGHSLDIEGSVNGVRRQLSNTRELIFSFEQLVEFVSGVMTLHAGDIISTGTPAGVGPIRHGDQVTVSVSGIGDLVNDVISSAAVEVEESQ